MSYDIWLTIDTGGDEPACLGEGINMTSNVAGMWDAAMPERNLRDMDGCLAADCKPILRLGVARMEDDPARFKAMEPMNGWGDYAGAVQFLRDLTAMCAKHPKASVRVSR